MKLLFTLVLFFGFFSAHAETASSSITLYYVGESILTNDSDVTRSPYLIARNSDQAAGTISEVVISRQQGGFKENSALVRIVNNHFTMTESTGTVTGEGELTGVAWNWTFLRAEFKVPNYGMRIIDYNFFADPNSLSGHKDFYMKNKTGLGEYLVMQEDVVAFLVSQEVFEAKRSELLGK